MRIENYNMTRKEAERLGLRPGRKFEHYFINNANGKPEHRRTGRVEKLHKFFFVARVKGKKWDGSYRMFPLLFAQKPG